MCYYSCYNYVYLNTSNSRSHNFYRVLFFPRLFIFLFIEIKFRFFFLKLKSKGNKVFLKIYDIFYFPNSYQI